MDKKIVCIGDIHSNEFALVKILVKLGFRYCDETETWTNQNNYFLVFLGDITDTSIQDNRKSAVNCIDIVRCLVEQGFAELIHSNHQDKLIRYLNGNKIIPSYGFQNTIDEIEKCSLDYKGELYIWLKERPLYYEFTINNKLYVCVHAYINEEIYKRANHSKCDETNKELEWLKSSCIYGRTMKITEESVTRTVRIPEWWKTYKNDKFHLIAGHSHQYFVGEDCHIIDHEKTLLAWIIEEDKYVGVYKGKDLLEEVV